MGDKTRNRTFAAFIGQTFADHKYVAGGNGELSFLLQRNHGKTPTLVEPRPRAYPKWIEHEIHSLSSDAKEDAQIRDLQAQIDQIDVSEIDLIVAMQPDEATEPAMRAGIANNIDFAIVPCCPFPLEGKKRFGKEWIRYLAALGSGIKTSRLDITGPNTCLWRSSAEVDANTTDASDERERILRAVAGMPRVRTAGSRHNEERQ